MFVLGFFFLVVGTNCGPVAESLSSCLLKISGNTRGGRGRRLHMERDPCLNPPPSVLSAGHPAEKALTAPLYPPHGDPDTSPPPH